MTFPVLAALAGGLWAPGAPGKEQELLALDPTLSIFHPHGSRENFSPWNQEIGQLWATSHKTPDFLLGTMEPAGGGTQTCSLRVNIWTFLRFPAWEAIMSFFPSFGEEFGFFLCSPLLCSLLSSQPALRSSRDALMSLFHDNISFQAPAFAFRAEEILYFFHLLSLLLSHSL